MMPMGNWHEERGLLLEQDGQIVLRRADGGTWRLEAPWKARRLLEWRVRLPGVRGGFDLLAVDTTSGE